MRGALDDALLQFSIELADLLCGSLALGNVVDSDHRHQWLTVGGVDERAAVTEDPAPVSLEAADAHLQVAKLLAAQDTGERPLVHRPDLAVHASEFERFSIIGQAASAFVQAGKAVLVQRGTVEVQQLATEVGNRHALAEVFQNRLKLNLALA